LNNLKKQTSIEKLPMDLLDQFKRFSESNWETSIQLGLSSLSIKELHQLLHSTKCTLYPLEFVLTSFSKDFG
jgi:hypothetical protein